MTDRIAKAFSDLLTEELNHVDGMNTFLPKTNYSELVESKFTEEGVILTIEKLDGSQFDLVLKPVEWRRHVKGSA